MPDPANYDSEDEWMAACVPTRLDEGMEQEQAVASCLNQWRERSVAASVTRAYSVLEVKSVDSERREIEGLATTPAVDVSAILSNRLAPSSRCLCRCCISTSTISRWGRWLLPRRPKKASRSRRSLPGLPSLALSRSASRRHGKRSDLGWYEAYPLGSSRMTSSRLMQKIRLAV
jgi:hypothetical protein